MKLNLEEIFFKNPSQGNKSMTFTSKNLSNLQNSILHAVVGFIVYGGALWLMQNQAIGAMTVGSVISLGLKWLDGKFGQ